MLLVETTYLNFLNHIVIYHSVVACQMDYGCRVCIKVISNSLSAC
jgi:hypothetical protein